MAETNRHGSADNQKEGGLYPDLSDPSEGLHRRNLRSEQPHYGGGIFEREEQDTDQKTTTVTSRWGLWYGLLAGVIIGIVIGLLLGVVVHSVLYADTTERPELEAEPEDPLNRDRLVSDFIEKFDGLRGRFPAQSERFWRTIKASVKGVMRTVEPAQPAAFLVPVSDVTLATATCLLRQLSDVITESYGTTAAVNHIDVSAMVEKETPAAVKLFLDNTLQDHLEAGSKVSVIHHLEKIPPPTVLVFHGYCDNENAPYKDSVFFYIVHLSAQPVPEDHSVVQDAMMEMWSDLHPSSYMPVLSRIGRTIAYVTPEHQDILANECGAGL